MWIPCKSDVNDDILICTSIYRQTLSRDHSAEEEGWKLIWELSGQLLGMGRWSLRCGPWTREYELITEAHTQLSVVWNCSRSSLRVCLEEGKRGETAGGRGEVSISRGWGEADSTQGERIWSSFQRQKVERGLLLLIHILCPGPFLSRGPPNQIWNPSICSSSYMRTDFIFNWLWRNLL